MKEINVMPRRSGKTTQILKNVQLLLESGVDPERIYIITVNSEMADLIDRRLKMYKPAHRVNIRSNDSLSDNILRGIVSIGKYFVFLDDYLYYNNKQKINDFLNTLSFVSGQEVSVIAYTISDRFYDRKVVNTLRMGFGEIRVLRDIWFPEVTDDELEKDYFPNLICHSNYNINTSSDGLIWKPEHDKVSNPQSFEAKRRIINLGN